MSEEHFRKNNSLYFLLQKEFHIQAKRKIEQLWYEGRLKALDIIMEHIDKTYILDERYVRLQLCYTGIAFILQKKKKKPLSKIELPYIFPFDDFFNRYNFHMYRDDTFNGEARDLQFQIEKRYFDYINTKKFEKYDKDILWSIDKLDKFKADIHRYDMSFDDFSSNVIEKYKIRKNSKIYVKLKDISSDLLKYQNANTGLETLKACMDEYVKEDILYLQKQMNELKNVIFIHKDYIAILSTVCNPSNDIDVAKLIDNIKALVSALKTHYNSYKNKIAEYKKFINSKKMELMQIKKDIKPKLPAIKKNVMDLMSNEFMIK